MQALNSTMCLKVNRDTFVYPDSNRGVYLRNNVTSIRMEGNTIEKWLEKLIPLFDGNHTLEYITNGLPDSYKDQVYKIAQALYEKGFVRDISQDLSHQLPDHIVTKYASQIEYINHNGDSGGYRFQVYRQAKVAVIGSGSLLLSLVLSMIQSGHPNFTIISTDSEQIDHRRLDEIIAKASSSEPETEITLLFAEKNVSKENLEPFDFILYGSKDSDLDQLRTIQGICRDQGKHFLPVTILKDLAFAGPFVSAESEGCWESLYRRLHQRSYESNGSNAYSTTAGALLANVAVFELFKEITGVQAKIQNGTKEKLYYLLNLETLEGNWHTLIPHPLVSGCVNAEPIKDPLAFLEKANKEQKDLHSLFYQITSKESGIFHLCEEEDLLQLPLSQCKVQVADPRSEGPTQLHPEIVCSGLTHEEARLEAGLSGIEMYVRSFGHLLDQSDHTSSWGIGTGATALDSLCRALQNGLHEELVKQSHLGAVSKLELSLVNNDRCQFFINALSTLRSEPELYLGQELFGFPVVWVKSNCEWYGSVGLNRKIALCRALQTALMDAQNKETFGNPYGVMVSSITLKNEVQPNAPVPSFEEESLQETFSWALDTLKNNKMQVRFFTIHAESILSENTAGLFGMTISGGEMA
ncbi:putative thiazole-containing bacteriocin maturation protein [Bacillus sp. NEB1478]|uniref:putative thiazole-containing bacteriocin maturation protein n=1 Tax=Bacillus sp. NEB1478 TaxID=3073816 RepID=UPI002873A6AD|nr:putative thiazole-containing bacteriocin maturation protein [Bacillus sp. NEB1478]WNB90909.1 putative thiazole-containing bacteriocin maturation protein [Bacillus sp. NEB1478]